ncbi:MAG: hypothetical protein MR691_08260 [Clostridium sp.]|nr:hypothetical protein [Clostridium sp.]
MKKIYKINDKIEVNELQEVARGIVLKALRVIETSGNKFASRIIEHKDNDTLEDLQQSVILELIKNNYIINKECYKIVNKMLYNYKNDKIKSVEIIVDDETNYSNIDYNSYVEYLKNDSAIEFKEIKNRFNIDELKLTDRQKEILNIYSKMQSMQQTADILKVSKSFIEKTMRIIKQKALKVASDIY